MKVEIEQIITQIISFLIILWILSRYAWKPLLKLLDERKERIHSDFSNLEEQKKQVEKLIAEYAEKLKALDLQAEEKMKQVAEEAKVEARKIEAQAELQAKTTLHQLQGELKKEIEQASSKMKKELVEISFRAAEKLLDKNVDQSEQKKLVEEFIDQLEVH